MRLFDLSQDLNEENAIVVECLEFLSHNGGADIVVGRHDVNEDGVYVSISDYTTRSMENAVWEAHKDYVDLQIVLSGEEYIHVSDLKNMKQGEYVKEKDFQQCEGEIEMSIHMTETKALLLMPEDAHMPSMSVGDTPTNVKKAVFKIPVKYRKEK